jgi:subtilisin family serine protease
LLAVASIVSVASGGGSMTAAASVRSGSPLPSRAGRQLSDDLQSAWEISRGQGVTVAVLSTGVDPSIPGLAGKVTTGPSYVPSRRAASMKGSLVAGMIAGSGDLLDSGGLTRASGVAPMARLLSIRVDMDESDPGSGAFYQTESYEDDSLLAEGIRYAADHGAQVIFVGISDEDDLTSAATEAAASYALSSGDVIVADDWSFSSDRTEYHFPAAYPGVIGVAGVNLPGEVPQGAKIQSQLNASMLVAAPNNAYPEPGPTGEIWAEDGAEAAATWVAGTAALIKSVFPHLSPVLVGRALALSARYRPAGGYSTTLGFGLINPAGALQEAAQLSRAHTQAAAGQAATTRFRPGPPLPAIDAVHHVRGKLAAYEAVIVVGVLCLIGALVLLWRRRSRRAPGGSEQLAEPQ